jgi:hypothetical protein
MCGGLIGKIVKRLGDAGGLLRGRERNSDGERDSKKEKTNHLHNASSGLDTDSLG